MVRQWLISVEAKIQIIIVQKTEYDLVGGLNAKAKEMIIPCSYPFGVLRAV